jgi:hypothetical protein
VATLLGVLKQRFFDSNGDPLVGGKVYSYQAGTSTPIATYTDQGGLTQNSNPIILDANGEASIWIIGSSNYKFVLTDANDNMINTVDQVSAFGVAAIPGTALVDGSVTTAKLADLSVTTAKLADDSVTTNKIDEDAVQTTNILDGSVTNPKLAAGAVGESNILDGAVSLLKRTIPDYQISVSSDTYNVLSTTGELDVTGLSVTLTTNGRPVLVAIQGSPSPVSSAVGFDNNAASVGAVMTVRIYRGTTIICERQFGQISTGSSVNQNFRFSPSTVQIDLPVAATHTYKVTTTYNVATGRRYFQECRLIAFEL